MSTRGGAIGELLERANGGDEEARVRVISAYLDDMTRSARRLLLMAGLDHESAVQESAVKAWQQWDRHAPIEHPGAWLRRMTARVCFRLLKTDDKRTKIEMENVGMLPRPSKAVRPDEITDRHPALGPCLERLRARNIRHFFAIVLVHVDGADDDEVAQDFGTTAVNVRKWRERGRSALRDCLQGQR